MPLRNSSAPLTPSPGGQFPREVWADRKALRTYVWPGGTPQDLRLTFGEGQTHGQFEVQFVKAIDYRTKENLLKAWRKRYPHTRSTDDILEMGGQKMSFGSLAGFPGYMSEKDATEYNAGVDRVFAQYEAFLRTWPAMVNARRRTLAFSRCWKIQGQLRRPTWTCSSGPRRRASG